MKRALFLLLFFTGCHSAAPDPATGGCLGGTVVDPLASITVADAHLEGLTLWQAGLGYGHTEGDALLVIHDTSGTETTFATRLDGSHVGLSVDASVDVPSGNYDLVLPTGTITARQLLGLYSGPHAGLDVGVGGHWRDLTNSSKVTLTIATLSFGLGTVPASWENLDLELWDDPLQVIPDPLFGGEGEGEGEGDEGEGDECAEAGHICFSDCCDGLVCVPGSDHGDGVCRVPCEAGCSGSDVCQTVVRGDGSAVVDACMPPGRALNDECLSTDVDACAEGLACRPIVEDADGNFDILRCRQPCDEADVVCPDGEQCLLSPLGTVHDCAVLVAATTSQNLDAPPFCDELDDVLYCDQSMFDGAANPGLSTCFDSQCLPLCQFPAIDLNDDGIIDDGDFPVERRDCADGFTCTPAVGLAIGLTEDVWLQNADGSTTNVRPCACPEGASCPADCGRDDAVCHDGGNGPRCIAPYGTCEPTPP